MVIGHEFRTDKKNNIFIKKKKIRKIFTNIWLNFFFTQRDDTERIENGINDENFRHEGGEGPVPSPGLRTLYRTAAVTVRCGGITAKSSATTTTALTSNYAGFLFFLPSAFYYVFQQLKEHPVNSRTHGRTTPYESARAAKHDL